MMSLGTHMLQPGYVSQLACTEEGYGARQMSHLLLFLGLFVRPSPRCFRGLREMALPAQAFCHNLGHSWPMVLSMLVPRMFALLPS